MIPWAFFLLAIAIKTYHPDRFPWCDGMRQKTGFFHQFPSWGVSEATGWMHFYKFNPDGTPWCDGMLQKTGRCRKKVAVNF